MKKNENVVRFLPQIRYSTSSNEKNEQIGCDQHFFALFLGLFQKNIITQMWWNFSIVEKSSIEIDLYHHYHYIELFEYVMYE